MKVFINPEILEAAKEILAANTECLLSGSIALRLAGKETRREPKDIDIYLPYGVEVKKVDGMVNSDTDGDNDEYDDEFYERKSYTYKGYQVDFFTPIIDDLPRLLEDNCYGVNCVWHTEIIKLKASHAYGEHWTRFKHVKDIIHLMNAID